VTNAFAALARGKRGEPTALLADAEPRGAIARWHLFRRPVDVLERAAGDAAGAFDALDAFLRRHERRACAGYLGYDLLADVEPLPRRIREDFAVPVLHVAAYAEVEAFPAEVPAPPGAAAASGVRAHMTRGDFEARVARVVNHIRAGDVFQVNLTQPFTGEYGDDPRLLFWRLCRESPAPRAAYVETAAGATVLSASPEEFLVVEGSDVRSRPIKGTRPRGDGAGDRRLLEELLASEKDRAELAMIVDLVRNDLGKVAATGSVAVGPFPEHRSFAQVHHTFAEVRARLSPGTRLVDVLRAAFPGGSVTGAPKLRAMEIIEELEVVRRGVYTGAIGSFGPGPRMDLNVAIRTLVWREGRVRFNTGGGITAESVPAAEFEETVHKARGLVAALACGIAWP
jgi:para-aminobenzoate synthetase component 1